jgi:hypothetical protein
MRVRIQVDADSWIPRLVSETDTVAAPAADPGHGSPGVQKN